MAKVLICEELDAEVFGAESSKVLVYEDERTAVHMFGGESSGRLAQEGDELGAGEVLVFEYEGPAVSMESSGMLAFKGVHR